MRSYGIIEGPVDVAVESYFRQCSVLVTVRDLAVMSGTLAFGGVNPVTGRRVVSEHVARDVVSVMASCGMYDFSGRWLLEVGLPAKSGVSGGLSAVAPSQFGVAAFSPRLDEHGNSVRASAIVELLVVALRDAPLRLARDPLESGAADRRHPGRPGHHASAGSSASPARNASSRCCATSPRASPRARS